MGLLENARAQVEASNRTLTTKAELVDYFREHYPGRAAKGKASWRQEIVRRLSELPGMNMSQKNLERRFDSGKKGGENRLDRQPRTKREKEQYIELGKDIGPVPPKNGYSVTWNGEIRISNTCFPREFGPLLIQGEDADHLAATGDMFIIFKVYFQGEDLAEGWCGSPFLEIRPAGDGETQMSFKHGPQGSSKFGSILKKKKQE